MKLFPAERFVLSIIVALFVIDATLITLKGIRIDYAGYLVCGLLGGGVFILGQFYRNSGRDLHIAAALTSAGLFVLFTLVASVFNYMFLPVRFAIVDPLLFRIDGAFGYSWPDVVTWSATHPLVAKILYAVYATSLPQLLLIVITLGFTGRRASLHHFLVTGVLGALTCIIFWIFFPTLGPSAYQTFPQWVMQVIPLAVDAGYGRELVRLAYEGVVYLTPKDTLGLIGFPSFHIVMAAMSVWFVPRHWAFRAVIWPLNALMVPAVLVQGGHHLVDIAGGLLVFAIICPVSAWLLNRMAEREKARRAPLSQSQALATK
ncbi:phosphatase PAP2 family protein [Agrobacterium tumefaciens]|uniref:phosphatase PAP2 family protein n=1 Tax=Agrobacterium tumefaciens TaxID=358 RepID=UPI0021D3343E|nr:phosphatase PAP2 family protein [Agrobacterium tumefaciens]UXS00972.1 hypothetical protein FY156_05435 [Agrobacterium tumefaciens]